MIISNKWLFVETMVFNNGRYKAMWMWLFVGKCGNGSVGGIINVTDKYKEREVKYGIAFS